MADRRKLDMPGKDWETEFGPNMEEHKNNSSLHRDISCVVLQNTEAARFSYKWLRKTPAGNRV